MGIFCQINLFKPPDFAFKPGETVSGIIKYAIHEPMEFERITTSLKGMGRLRIKVDKGKRDRTYTSSENYVDIDNVITATTTEVPVGCYEIKFTFKIPDKVPSTLTYNKRKASYKVRCSIKYYIRIKFEKPGWFAFSKHFRKEINVSSSITPQLLMEPVIYGESKKLMRLFSRKNAIVSIKATIINSVIPIGGKIHVNYEVKNDTNVVIDSVETKLVEIYSFKASGCPVVTHNEDVPNTSVRTSSIDCGVIKSLPLGIDLPMDRVSLQNSKMVARDYLVRFTVELPMPHRNVVLDIPIQIDTLPGFNIPSTMASPPNASPMTYDDPPPSYWEVMGETVKSDKFDDEYDNDFERGEKSGTS